MAGTLQTRIQVYTGTISDTTTMTDMINAGIKSVINAIPEEKIEKYASPSTDTGTGVDVSSIRVVRAHKSGYRARKIDPGLKTQVLNGCLFSVSVSSGGTGYSVGNVLTLSQGTGGTCTVATVSGGVVTSVTITTVGYGFTQGIKTTTVSPSGGTGCTLLVTPNYSSIHQAVTTDPVYYIENSKAYVIPAGGTIIGMGYPSNIAYNSTSIPNFPSELEQAVILYVAIQELLFKTNTIYDSITSLALDSITAPTAPLAASFTFTTASYTDAAYSNGTFTPATIDTTAATTIGLLPTSPVYTAPTCSLTAAPSDLSIITSLPTTPNAPAYSYSDATLGTYTATTIGSLGTPPTYTKPTVSIPATPIDFALAITTVAPTAPADSSYSYSDATLGTYTSTTIGSLGTAPTYTKPTISLTAAPSDFSYSISVVFPTPPSAPAYSYTDATLGTYTATTIGALGSAPTYTKPTTTFSVSDATTYIATAEDLEKAQTEISKQRELLNQYVQDINNELNEYNSAVEVYRASLQTAIKQAELDQERLMLSANKTTDLSIQNKAQTLSAGISLYRDSLQLYSEEVDAYAKIVNKELELYKVNLEKWINDRQTLLQQYSLDIQNEVNEYQKELAIYQSTVQQAIRQAELDQERLMLSASKTTDLSIQNKAQTLNADISLYKDKLQKFVEQIDLFRAQVDSEIQTYRTNLDKWQIDRQSLLTQYSQDIQNELNEFNKENVEYQSTVQKAIRQAELDQERLMLNANKSTDLSIQNQAQTLNAAISLYKDTLQKYVDDLEAYRETVNTQVQVYRANLEKWTVDRQTQLGLYSSDIQNAVASFNKDLAVYNAGMQKLIRQAELDQQRLMDQSQKVVQLNEFNAQKAIETALQNNQQSAAVDIQNRAKAAEVDILNKTKTVEVSIQQYQANLQNYQAQLDSYGHDVNKAVQKYSLGIQKAVSQLQSMAGIIEQCRKEFQTIMSLI